MSVESDTTHYYADLDREMAREAAIEREAESRSEDIASAAYDWITERFGENTAIALTDPEGYTDAEVVDSVHEARAHFTSWLTKTSEDAAIAALED